MEFPLRLLTAVPFSSVRVDEWISFRRLVKVSNKFKNRVLLYSCSGFDTPHFEVQVTVKPFFIFKG